jgi:hypothetical protein
MRYYTRSTSAVERPHPLPDNGRTLVCLSCGDTMRNLRSIPRLGVRREQLIFVCPSCKAVDTKEPNGAE